MYLCLVLCDCLVLVFLAEINTILKGALLVSAEEHNIIQLIVKN